MDSEAERSFRRVVLLATLGGVAFIMLPILVFWYRLPDNMVMRWDIHGAPAWGVPKWIYLLTYLGMYLFGAFIALRQRENATGPLMMLTCMGGVLGLVTWYGAYAQIDTTHWQEAAKLPPTTLAGILLLPVVAMLIVGRIAKYRWSRSPEDNDFAAESDDMGAQSGTEQKGEAAFYWSGVASNGWTLAAAITLAASTAYFFVVRQPGWASAQLATAVVLEWASFTRVSVDDAALQIKYGRLGWIRQTVPLERVSEVSVVSARPFTCGGWGYRGSLKLFKRAAVIIRGGPALRLSLTGEQELVVTVDDAPRAADLLRTLTSKPNALHTQTQAHSSHQM